MSSPDPNPSMQPQVLPQVGLPRPFPGMPTQLLTIEGYIKSLNGRKVGNHKVAFAKHIISLMRMKSGKAHRFLSEYLHISHLWYCNCRRTSTFTPLMVDILKTELNVDASIFMDGRYPPISSPNPIASVE